MAKYEKLINLELLQEFAKLVEKKIPVYTKAEYESQKDSIPKNTLFIISDDAVDYSSVASTTSLDEESLDELFGADDTSIDDGSDDPIGDLF